MRPSVLGVAFGTAATCAGAPPSPGRRAVTPLVHTVRMSANEQHGSVADLPQDVVEPWFCPVCDGPAHRTRRPGRPKLYCSNACRQRAYRWRRDHHARADRSAVSPGCGRARTDGPLARAPAPTVTSWATLSDRRNRYPDRLRRLRPSCSPDEATHPSPVRPRYRPTLAALRRARRTTARSARPAPGHTAAAAAP